MEEALMSGKGVALSLRVGSGLKLLVHLAAFTSIIAILFWPSPVRAQCPSPGGVCATPGKDGAGGTLTGVVNAYYPGTGNPVAAATIVEKLLP